MQYIPQRIFDRVSIKNIKEGFGHDLLGFFCDIYLDGKKIAYINVDGGAHPDLVPYQYTDKNKAKMLELEQLMKDSNFLEFVDKAMPETLRGRHWSFEELVYDLCERFCLLKVTKKYEQSAIVFGNPSKDIKQQKFTMPISDVIARNEKLFIVTLNDIKKQLLPDDYIFNTNISKYL